MPLFLEFALLGLFMFGLYASFGFLVKRAAGNPSYKLGLALALVAAFMLFWVNGAVGVIGSENNDANMSYFVLVLMVFLGSIASRFRAGGLRIVMAVAAIAMVIIATAALGFSMGVNGPIWPWDVVWITVFFFALWSLSAWFFHQVTLETEGQTSSDP
jgi:hypothetical protein